MIVTIYDTETTGIHHGFKSRSLDDPRHPHLVQVSALQVDVSNRANPYIRQSINLVVRPDGWEIPEAASNIHGITEDKAKEYGLPEFAVLSTFLRLWMSGGKVHERVAHNATFDKNVIATAIARYHSHEDLLDVWLTGTDFCTMQSSRNIVQACNKRGTIKAPTLMECHKHFFGEPFDKAHSANADVVATLNVYLALLQQEEKEERRQ